MRCAKPDPVESKGPVEAVVPVVIVGRERFSGFGAGLGSHCWIIPSEEEEDMGQRRSTNQCPRTISSQGRDVPHV